MGPLSADQMPHRRPGLWSQTISMDGAPADGPGTQLCVDADSEAKMSIAAQNIPGAHCPPPQLSRTELMVRTGPAEVALLENERWASPVNEEIKSALRLELQRRLAPLSGLRPDLTKLTLDVDVQHLEAELGQYALIEASWSATLSAAGQRSNDVRVTTCTFQADEKIHSGYVGMVEGYQREVAALADAIVAVVTSLAGGIDAPCRPGRKDH